MIGRLIALRVPRSRVAQLTGASLAALLALMTPQQRAMANDVTLGVAPIVPYANSTIAATKGYFTANNLNVNRKLIFASDVIRSALSSGDIDIAAMSLDAVLRGHVAGFGWKLLFPAVIYDPKTPDAYLMARADLDLKSPKDLEGKTIAMAAGSIGELGAKAWMRQNGVDLSKIKVVEIPLPQMVGALESKRVDAGHMVYPGVTVALEKGIGKIVGPDLDSIGGRFLVSTYVAKGSWIDANPEKAAKFVEAMRQATQFIIDKPDEALPIIAKETKLDPALAAKFFPSRYVAATSVPVLEIQTVIDFLVREKYLDKPFSYTEVVSKYMPLK